MWETNLAKLKSLSLAQQSNKKFNATINVEFVLHYSSCVVCKVRTGYGAANVKIKAADALKKVMSRPM